VHDRRVLNVRRQEELLDHSPAAHVRRPRVGYESHAVGLDRNELGALLVAAGPGPAAEHAIDVGGSRGRITSSAWSTGSPFSDRPPADARYASRAPARGRAARRVLVRQMRIASPERRWRAAAAPLIGVVLGWQIGGLRLAVPHGPALAVTAAGRLTTAIAGLAIGTCVAVLVMRTHLTISDGGLADHRLFRVVRLPWPSIAAFEVGRPGWFWGGFCVRTMCRDGTTVDLLSTRAYSWLPSGGHLDELHRICWSLEEAATRHAD
jgi:hypothetical protein